MRHLIFSILLTLPFILYSQIDPTEVKLTKEQASKFADAGLNCIQNKNVDKPEQASNEITPGTYACIDWNSSVHAYWMLVKLLKEFPDLPQAMEIRETINQNINSEVLEARLSHLLIEESNDFEKSNGWIWQLKLSAELHDWNDSDGKIWKESLQPLMDEIVEKYLEYLPRLEQANKTGDQTNTAFGLALAWDYAIKSNSFALKELVENRTIDYYLGDQNCQTATETGDKNLFSPCLTEAALMATVVPAEVYIAWIDRFLPEFRKGDLKSFGTPLATTNNNDNNLQVYAINLSRAWCLFKISSALGSDITISTSAQNHLNAVMPHLTSDEHTIEPYLATFAVHAFYSSQQETIPIHLRY